MPDREQIKTYSAYLKMYGEILCDLSDSEIYIHRLILDDCLDDFEKALVKKIGKAISTN